MTEPEVCVMRVGDIQVQRAEDGFVPWRVWVNGEAHPRCSTPAEAMDAAEREAGW